MKKIYIHRSVKLLVLVNLDLCIVSYFQNKPFMVIFQEEENWVHKIAISENTNVLLLKMVRTECVANAERCILM